MHIHSSIGPAARGLAGAGVLLLALGAARGAELFPFVIPGLDAPAADSVANMAALNDAPAGKDGFVRVGNGHFVVGRGKRLRFLATNFTFGNAFPDHDSAERLAARLASLGINCVRFHHMDAPWASDVIFAPDKRALDPSQLERLDYFIAQLKRHGVYADLNLHVSRNYWEGEDFPDGLANDRERQQLLPHYGKGIDRLDAHMIRMQRDYARALLTHTNAFTGNAYAAEPAVALVEPNNENTLLELKVGALPDYYRREVLAQWNAWLRPRYGATEKLAAAWGAGEPLGADVLPGNWSLQGPDYFDAKGGTDGVTRVTVRKLPAVSWHAQLHQMGLTLAEGRLYTLAFRARGTPPRKLSVDVRRSKDDWHNCGLDAKAALTADWKPFSFVFRAARVEPGAVRLGFLIGDGPVGEFELKDLALRAGGSFGVQGGETLEAATVGDGEGNAATERHTDWVRFLAQTERGYTEGLRTFVKKELGVRAPLIDTQASYGGLAGAYRESTSDYVDMHAYWQHPHFPHKAWDGADWTIPNTPMSAAKDGANFARLAAYRVAGLPFAVSEYDHPAPSHYSAEMFPMIASFAAVQDWDGFFQFDWGGDKPNGGKIDGYFSLQQHPGKLAFLPIAAMMFRRSDVEPARGELALTIPAGEVETLAAGGLSMADAWEKAGAEPDDLLGRRMAISFPAGGKLAATRTGEAGSAVAWDAGAGLYTVDAAAVKAVVGRCAGKTTRLDGAEFDVAANERGFAVLALAAADAKPLAASRRLLLVAAGNVENTGMGWNAAHTTVGRNWGRAPTVCEGIGAKVSIATKASKARVYALDGAGARTGEVPATVEGGKLRFEIGPQFKTLWYEIAAE